ncbi:TIGR03086 family metal-binding protein [Tomitella gaofuii]|uniref:TIGR03086 family metal-binding protein n=1 Tax=Tomitella gaofuii TaxID=2760083 RepID=UPI0015FADCDE|nr:TIGR03086 family metal-binding protein [Tomitella gaofuii]
MDVIAANHSAADTVDKVLATVPPDAWDRTSRCPEWTLRDVAAHVIWGRDVITAAAGGQDEIAPWGTPGTPSPGQHLGGADPAVEFHRARRAADAAMATGGLGLPGPEFLRRAKPEATAGDFATILVADLLAHAWDIGSAVGAPIEVDPEALAFALSSTSGPIRAPGMFADPVDVGPDATAYERFLGFLGRDPRPV